MPNYKIIGGDQREYGPVSETELRQWIAEGRLSAQSAAQLEGNVEWKPLGSFPDFAEALRAQVGAQPLAAPGTSAGKAAWANEILAREPSVQFGDCLMGGWRFFASQPGFVFGTVFVVWLVFAVKSAVGFVPAVGGILSMVVGLAYLILAGVLTGGFCLACLRRMRGEPAAVGDVFAGFKSCFVPLMLGGLLTTVLTQIGFMVCLFPGIYLLVGWVFTLPLIADKRLEFWSAMELSRKVVTRVWFQTALLLFIAFLPTIVMQFVVATKFVTLGIAMARDANFDVLKVLKAVQEHEGEFMAVAKVWTGITLAVVLFNLLFAVGAVLRAYENLFGPRKS